MQAWVSASALQAQGGQETLFSELVCATAEVSIFGQQFSSTPECGDTADNDMRALMRYYALDNPDGLRTLAAQHLAVTQSD
ncbi:hypothetical protein OAX78_02040 [Planctomycetota bacterium]|nr:hypothetical protein [Planctomycetota bacterium]